MPTPQTDAAELAQILRLVYQVLVFVRSNYILKLFACVLVDAIGFSSFLLPGIGELGDVGWAPLQAWFLYFMFGSVRMSGIGFMEEILPGTDFVPSASIAWACENIDVTTLDALRALSGVVLRSHARSPRSLDRHVGQAEIDGPVAQAQLTRAALRRPVDDTRPGLGDQAVRRIAEKNEIGGGDLHVSIPC